MAKKEYQVAMNVSVSARDLQCFVAVMTAFGNDVLSGYEALNTAGINRASVHLAFCDDKQREQIVTQKERPLRSTPSLLNHDGFMAVTDLLWQLANYDGIGKILSVAYTTNSSGEVIATLSLCSHPEEADEYAPPRLPLRKSHQ